MLLASPGSRLKKDRRTLEGFEEWRLQVIVSSKHKPKLPGFVLAGRLPSRFVNACSKDPAWPSGRGGSPIEVRRLSMTPNYIQKFLVHTSK